MFEILDFSYNGKILSWINFIGKKRTLCLTSHENMVAMAQHCLRIYVALKKVKVFGNS